MVSRIFKNTEALSVIVLSGGSFVIFHKLVKYSKVYAHHAVRTFDISLQQEWTKVRQ